MYLLVIEIEVKIIIGISVMLLLFVSFLFFFVGNQRKKLQYHKSLHALESEQQEALRLQNAQLEKKVEERTRELFQQKEDLQKSLVELRSTQLQLIQREKMASLGELTAGIAHEIQNPLNFVNNFSEISTDRLDEVKEELMAGNQDLAIKALDEASLNLKKILHHGKRAGAIVRSMLEHSRQTGRDKESTDINFLVEEYLKLAYHGYRVKDSNFTVDLITNYDPFAGKIDIMPQEIGRVLVNLFNNAFYSVQQKKQKPSNDYTPTIEVTTVRKPHQVEIAVKDNGVGIPEKILSKVYQPFFTTKPAGEGTGLGLSLSYDVITKVHGGNLLVTSKEGNGAEFLIQLPIA